jgi:hypothetical protein
MGYQLELAGPKESVAAFRLTDRSTSEAVIDHTRSEDTVAGTADVRRCHSSKAVGLKGYGCFRKSRTAAPDPERKFMLLNSVPQSCRSPDLSRDNARHGRDKTARDDRRPCLHSRFGHRRPNA